MSPEEVMSSQPAFRSFGYPPARANAELKNRYASFLGSAIVFSVVAHFVVLSVSGFGIADYSIGYSAPMEQLELTRKFEIPPPPQEIPRPAVPILSTNININQDITIGSVRFDDNPVDRLPPPPLPNSTDLSETPAFTPYSIKPELRNSADLQRALERLYPRAFRDAGIGGTTLLWVFIDIAGAVQNTRVVESSGYPELDDAAQVAVRSTARFSPAYNRDQRVPVWIQLPITFKSVATTE
jgi:TonB family protein